MGPLNLKSRQQRILVLRIFIIIAISLGLLSILFAFHEIFDWTYYFHIQEMIEVILIFTMLYIIIKLSIDAYENLSELEQTNQDYSKLLESQKRLLEHTSHELKTPISKGKFALELLEDNPEYYKEQLKNIFEALESITNDLLLYERLEIDTYIADRADYNISYIISNAIESLFLTNYSKFTLTIKEDFKLNCNEHYMSIAFKNLIDNSIKYTKSLPIRIVVENNSVSFINQSDPLDYDLSYYITPYNRGDNRHIGGFGLGLSIVHKIITLHDLKLSYSAKDGEAIFRVSMVQ